MSLPKLNFSLEFTGREYIKAKDKTKYSNDFFFFMSNDQVYKIDLQFSYVFSQKVKEMILIDQSTYEYKLTQHSYSKDLLDNFFNSIEDNVISIDPSYLIEFINLSTELGLGGMKKSIESNVLSYLCNSINQSQSFVTDSEKYDFLEMNYITIDLNILKDMPREIIKNIINKAKYKNEDEHVLFIIEDFIPKFENEEDEYFLIELISKVNFENLSFSALEKVIPFIEKVKNRSLLIDNFISIFKKELKKRKEINFLNITEKGGIDFNFLHDLNSQNDDYKINVTIVYHDDIYAKFETEPDYFFKFDVLSIGGKDCFHLIIPKIQEIVFDKMWEYHQKGGTIILIHDAYDKKIQSFFDLFNSKGCKFIGGLNKAIFNDDSEKVEVITSPFCIGKEFIVDLSHGWVNIDPKYIVLYIGQKNEYSVYYAENLKENIGFNGIGHGCNPTDPEKKLFYNTICHLFDHNHALKKIKSSL